MAKIKRKKMARGTKIAPEHIWSDGLSNVKDSLENVNVDDNVNGVTLNEMEKNKGTFRLNFSIPYIHSEWTKANGTDKPYIIPFMLPPLQEFWDADGRVNETTKDITMTEFSFSLDQRDESVMITDQMAAPSSDWDAEVDAKAPNPLNFSCWDYFKTNMNQGKMYSDLADFSTRGLTLEFSVLEKQCDYYNPPSVDFHAIREIYNLPIPISDLLASNNKANPYAETNLSININPYKTYMVGIKPFNLHDVTGAGNTLALVNINISIKFKHELVTRDHSGNSHTPCNMPEHGSQKVAEAITMGVPAAGSTIESDTANGINTSINTLDKIFEDKLQGGLSPGSDIGVVEHLCQDAGYEVIAIPMWNNQWNNQTCIKNVICDGTAPYSVGYASTGQSLSKSGLGAHLDQWGLIMDRAIVPINFPMTIHHVIVAHNNLVNTNDNTNKRLTLPYHFGRSALPANNYDAGWVASSDEPVAPTIANLQVKHNIGIGIGTGCRGLAYGYQQIVNYDGQLRVGGTPSTTGNVIDGIRMNYPTSTARKYGPAGPTVGTNEYSLVNDVPEWTLSYLPLMNQGNAVAPGLFTSAGVKATTSTQANIQDTPYFIGNSWEIGDPTGMAASPGMTAFKGPSVRTNDETETGLQRDTDQWIEVRWGVNGNVNGVDGWNGYTNTMGAANLPNNGDHSRVINGYGGSWIYIIGKKHTVSDENWKQHYQKKGVNSNA